MATYNTATIAEKFETDPRTLRKFLRSDSNDIESVGKGKRYEIEGSQLRSLKASFAKWESDRMNPDTDDETEESDEVTEVTD